MGRRPAPQALDDPFRIMRISLFPLSGALLYPGLSLPLHIFEPRYRALVSDALARDRRIGMIQPQRYEEGAPLYSVGTLGRISDVEALEDGRFNIVLAGETRFRILRELPVTTLFRQAEAEVLPEDDKALSAIERAMFESEARAFAKAQGYAVDWDDVTRLDDRTLINGVAQIAPFDAAAKQMLLESDDISARCEALVQLMQFYGRREGDAGTLQ